VADSRSIPDARSRWRCAHCGNLTRFDVVRSTRSRVLAHVDGRRAERREREVLAETVEQVVCRWCGAGDRVEIVDRPEFGGPADEGPGDGGP
jgi:hypothetical protein